MITRVKKIHVLAVVNMILTLVRHAISIKGMINAQLAGNRQKKNLTKYVTVIKRMKKKNRGAQAPLLLIVNIISDIRSVRLIP